MRTFRVSRATIYRALQAAELNHAHPVTNLREGFR